MFKRLTSGCMRVDVFFSLLIHIYIYIQHRRGEDREGPIIAAHTYTSISIYAIGFLALSLSIYICPSHPAGIAKSQEGYIRP